MRCPYCLEEKPGSDTEMPLGWFLTHTDRSHRWSWWWKRKWGRLLCHFEFHKHPESSAPAWWTCERVDCQREFHQRW